MARDFTPSSSDLVTGTVTVGATQALTMLARVYADTKGSYRGILDSHGGSNFAIMMISGGAGNPLGYMWGAASGDEYDIAGPALNTGEWTACAVAVSSTAASLYTGTQSGSQNSATNTKSHESITPSTTWNIGKEEGDNGRTFDGRIAEVAIYLATLTAAECLGYQRGYSPLLIRPQSLLSYVPLVRDLSDLKTGAAWTATGTTVADHPAVIMPRRRIVGTFAGTSPPPPPPTYIGARYQMIGVQQFSGGRAA